MDPARWSNLEALMRHLSGAARTLALYPPSHPAVAKSQRNILQVLASLLDQQEITQVRITEDRLLVVEGTPWSGPGDQVGALLDRMRKREVGTVTFLRGITRAEVRFLLEVLAMDPVKLAQQGGAAWCLSAKGARHLVVAAQNLSVADVTEDGQERRQVLAVYTRAVEAARTIMGKVRVGELPQAGEVRQVIAGLTGALLRAKHVILGLTLLKSYDEYLFNHSVNVAVLALALGHALGLDPEVLREVGFGAFLHDIGKVIWPEWLYRKPGALTPAEWELVRRHPLDGLKIVEQMHGSAIAKAIVLEHHVRFDRGEGGYPALPAGMEPSFFGRLACVVDGYDAMTTHRAYRRALDPSGAVAEIRSLSGAVYDPKLVAALVRMVGLYPVGTLVRLTTGELAVVLRPQEDPARPRVRLVVGADGMHPEGGPEIDLMERDPRTKEYVLSIVLPVDPSAKNIDVARIVASAA